MASTTVVYDFKAYVATAPALPVYVHLLCYPLSLPLSIHANEADSAGRVVLAETANITVCDRKGTIGICYVNRALLPDIKNAMAQNNVLGLPLLLSAMKARQPGAHGLKRMEQAHQLHEMVFESSASTAVKAGAALGPSFQVPCAMKHWAFFTTDAGRVTADKSTGIGTTCIINVKEAKFNQSNKPDKDGKHRLTSYWHITGTDGTGQEVQISMFRECRPMPHFVQGKPMGFIDLIRTPSHEKHTPGVLYLYSGTQASILADPLGDTLKEQFRSMMNCAARAATLLSEPIDLPPGLLAGDTTKAASITQSHDTHQAQMIEPGDGPGMRNERDDLHALAVQAKADIDSGGGPGTPNERDDLHAPAAQAKVDAASNAAALIGTDDAVPKRAATAAAAPKELGTKRLRTAH